MSNRTWIAACSAAIACCGAARAETGAWVFEIKGDTDASGAFEPGEVPMIRLSIDMSPDVKAKIGDEEVVGFAGLRTDVKGQSNWATGNVTWRMNPNLIFWTGDLTSKDAATQDLRGMEAFQFTWIGGGFGLDQTDPILIAEITWDPQGDYTPRRVEARTRLEAHSGEWTSDKEIGVWLAHLPGSDDRLVTWPTEDASFSFQIVPAPSVLALAGTLALPRARRRY